MVNRPSIDSILRMQRIVIAIGVTNRVLGHYHDCWGVCLPSARQTVAQLVKSRANIEEWRFNGLDMGIGKGS